MNQLISISETNGINNLSKEDKCIYSVGISTGGQAEIKMVQRHPNRHVIATTIDPEGAQFAYDQIKKEGLLSQIEIKVENIATPLPYPADYFDYVYARLVLHYLSQSDLQKALSELYRILKSQGRLFVVVRSIHCWAAQNTTSQYDPITHLTHYCFQGKSCARYFHSEKSLREHLSLSSFIIKEINQYEERLCIDFERENPSPHTDHLIEFLAIRHLA